MPSAFELNPTFSFTLLGTFAIYMWTRPTRWVWAAVLILAAALRTACVQGMGGLGAYYGVRWISWGAFLGIASLIVLSAQVVRTTGPNRKSLMQAFYSAAAFPLLSLLIGYTIPLTTWLRPKTYDAFLLAFDGALGFQPSFVLGRLLLENQTAWGLTTAVYYALPLAASLVYASHRTRTRQPVAILALFLSLTVVGFVGYGLYPAVGPGHAFPEFYPRTVPSLRQIVLQPMSVPDSPRNCMPSLHLAGALAVWWNSRIWPRWGRLLAGWFLLATVFATLALGEHYLIDLVVAVPFTLIFQAAWTGAVPATQRVRREALWAGIMFTAIWLILLFVDLPMLVASPIIAWGLIAGTVAWCIVLQQRLAAAAHGYAASAAQYTNDGGK